MQGEFDQGTVLWLWYDAFLAVPALLVAVYLTYKAVVWYSWTRRVPLIAKGLCVLGTALVLLTVLDRVGVEVLSLDAEIYGIMSLAGAAFVVIVGGFATIRGRNRKEQRPQEEFQKERPEQERLAAVPPPAFQGERGSPASTMVLEKAPRTLAWLVVRSGGEPGHIFELTAERTTLGSTPDNDIQLDHPSVSSDHALILKQEGRFLLYDMGSRNGTWVSGKAVAGALLQDGSRITLGTSELVFTQTVREGGVQESRSILGRIVAGAKGLLSPLTGGPEEEGEGGEPIRRNVLYVQSGPSAGDSIAIGEEDLVIGRQPGEFGAQIADPAVSQRHALLRPTEQGCLIYDLGSVNGTAVDDVPLRGVLLHNGEVVRFGEAELQFVQEEPA